ncbi:hypothetical protein SCHPADRAFT_572312 [Schizopora paradoxa]|uniref:Uncharacterized protein n=1 Tax=Schizopora paradoxa TaxID=27342 RepID=A0A0H2RWU2_9AGAM|nr:hypothetical protein SCHPADRAFT_572312 [Schizopora paradoxa]
MKRRETYPHRHPSAQDHHHRRLSLFRRSTTQSPLWSVLSFKTSRREIAAIAPLSIVRLSSPSTLEFFRFFVPALHLLLLYDDLRFPDMRSLLSLGRDLLYRLRVHSMHLSDHHLSHMSCVHPHSKRIRSYPRVMRCLRFRVLNNGLMFYFSVLYHFASTCMFNFFFIFSIYPSSFHPLLSTSRPLKPDRSWNPHLIPISYAERPDA